MSSKTSKVEAAREINTLFGWEENWRERNWGRENEGENNIFFYLDNRRKWKRKKIEQKKVVGSIEIFFLLISGEKTQP